MKIIINENQYELLKEMEDKPKVYHFPSLEIFGHKKPMDNWNLMQKFLAKRGNPDFTIDGDLDLEDNLEDSTIESLGNLTSVGGDLDLYKTPIESLGELTTVGGNLYLEDTPISEKYTEEEIRSQVKVEGKLYLWK